MSEIDSFIQMYSNLKQRVMTDTEVDRIVNEASAMAEKSKNDEMLQHAAERIQETARGVKSNYDWSAIEKVDNVQELDRATNIYNARANNSAFHYDYTEKVLAKKLADLSKSEL